MAAAKGIRVRGVLEISSLNAWEKQPDDMKEIKQMLAFMNVDCDITEMRCLGPQHENRINTIDFEVRNSWHNRLILNSVKS